MKLLVIASDKGGRFAPFIEEQIVALEACGMKIVRYGIQGKGMWGYLRELPALRRLIRAERPDIVHAHYGLSGLLANLQRLVPVVTTYHGSDINLPHILRLSKIAMRLSAHNIFVSARSASLAMGNGQWAMESNSQSPIANRLKKRSTLLPCGVNIPKPWNEMKNQRVEQLTLNQWVQEKLQPNVMHVLFAGAFDNAVKDPELAKAAVEIAQAQIEDNKIKENSNNQQHRQLESTTLRANQHPCAIHEIRLVELKGYTREQVNALMYNCDALLLTSKTEGSPQVIKEAMACGCPIVSVDVGDVAERVSGVEGCYVVRTREPKDIAEALQKALAHEGKTKGRERILEMGLSNDQVVKRLIAIYQSLV